MFAPLLLASVELLTLRLPSAAIGAVAAAIALKPAGSSWLPVALLARSGVGIAIFRTHAAAG